jgi:polygalacturonase
MSLVAASVASAQSRKPGAPGTQGNPLQFNVRDFSAKGDGATKDTSAFQRALDRCAALGGGEVLVPAGNYRTARLRFARIRYCVSKRMP